MKGIKIFPDKQISNIFFDNKKEIQNKTIITKSNLKKRKLKFNNQNKNIKKIIPSRNFNKKNTTINNNSYDNLKEKIYKQIEAPTIEKLNKTKQNISCLFSEDYYKKFVNKPKNNNNNLINKRIIKKNKINKSNSFDLSSNNINNAKYELIKLKNDNKLIDISNIKKNFNKNGINIYKVKNESNSMENINKDKISFYINKNDINFLKFVNIKKELKNNSLDLKEININNKGIKISKDLFFAKTKWDSINYGRRDNIDNIEREKKFIDKINKKKDVNHFKKNILRNIPIDIKYKNNYLYNNPRKRLNKSLEYN